MGRLPAPRPSVTLKPPAEKIVGRGDALLERWLTLPTDLPTILPQAFAQVAQAKSPCAFTNDDFRSRILRFPQSPTMTSTLGGRRSRLLERGGRALPVLDGFFSATLARPTPVRASSNDFKSAVLWLCFCVDGHIAGGSVTAGAFS